MPGLVCSPVLGLVCLLTMYYKHILDLLDRSLLQLFYILLIATLQYSLLHIILIDFPA